MQVTERRTVPDPLLLLDVVRSWHADGEVADGLMPGHLPAAIRHGISGLFPDERDRALEQRHVAMVQRACHLSAKLTAAAVRHVVLRGPVTAAGYPSPALRYYADIDLLIEPSQIELARLVLTSIGLRQGTARGSAGPVTPASDDDLARESSEKRLHAFLADTPLPGGQNFVVEVHHRLRPPYMGGGDVAARLLDSRTDVTDPVTGASMPALAPLDRAVELGTHIEGKIRHLPALRARRDLRLGLYADMALLRAKTGLTRDCIAAHATSLGLATELDTALDACDEVLKASAPRAVDVYYFTPGACYRPVGVYSASFASRLSAGNTVPCVRWTVPPSEFDETAVLHPHLERGTR